MRTGLIPGVNVDRIDIAAGMRELAACGYHEAETQMVITYALQRWQRGEEEAAQRGAIDLRSTASTLAHGFECWPPLAQRETPMLLTHRRN